VIRGPGIVRPSSLRRPSATLGRWARAAEGSAGRLWAQGARRKDKRHDDDREPDCGYPRPRPQLRPFPFAPLAPHQQQGNDQRDGGRCNKGTRFLAQALFERG
jgi:hypothetical protein